MASSYSSPPCAAATTSSSSPFRQRLVLGLSYSSSFLHLQSQTRIRLSPLLVSLPPATPVKCFSRTTASATAGTGPPEPPDPFQEENNDNPPGLQETLSRYQDGVRIFFAVLFWMFLFFWAGAWDGRDNRTNGGPKFKK